MILIKLYSEINDPIFLTQENVWLIPHPRLLSLLRPRHHPRHRHHRPRPRLLHPPRPLPQAQTLGIQGFLIMCYSSGLDEIDVLPIIRSK